MLYQKLQSIRILNSDITNSQLEIMMSGSQVGVSHGYFCHNIRHHDIRSSQPCIVLQILSYFEEIDIHLPCTQLLSYLRCKKDTYCSYMATGM